MSSLVFVYGTLRKYDRNHHLLLNSPCIATQASVKGALYNTGNNYPALVTKNETGYVYGEVYEVDEATLQQLDELEDYKADRNSNLFNRITVDIMTDQGDLQGYTYVAGDLCSLTEPIQHSDWRVHTYLMSSPTNVYYYAYGSCMDQERFQLAKVDQYFQKEIGAGELEGFSMKYTFHVQDGGRADIIEDGSRMEGILYDCPPEAMDYLFQREGVFTQSYRPTFVDIKVRDTIYSSCLTFKVVHRKAEKVPPIHYAKEILRGSKGKVSQDYYALLVRQLRDLELDLTHEDIDPLIKN